MTSLGPIAAKIRSKNAGPFWVTVDVFCGNAEAYARVVADLQTERVASVFQTEPAFIKRFDMADLCVVKFSLPRPVTQGAIADRDMHGAGWAVLLSEIEI